jgi:hypothetical protein
MKNFYLFLILILPLAVSYKRRAQHLPSLMSSKNNGDIIYGKVTEVTFELVKYKRTDIPDSYISFYVARSMPLVIAIN